MAPNSLTDRDAELLYCAFLSQKDPKGFKVDYTKFAELAGLSNAASGATTWSALKKRLNASAEPAEAGSEQVTTAVTTKKRGREPESNEPKAPKKRAKKNGPKTEEGDDNADEVAPDAPANTISKIATPLPPPPPPEKHVAREPGRDFKPINNPQATLKKSVLPSPINNPQATIKKFVLPPTPINDPQPTPTAKKTRVKKTVPAPLLPEGSDHGLSDRGD
ncbi:MAG: hypothetical protein Q9195_003048 [Heterodermia aff. obscurata]